MEVRERKMKKGNGTVRLEDGRNGGERGRLERGAGAGAGSPEVGGRRAEKIWGC